MPTLRNTSRVNTFIATYYPALVGKHKAGQKLYAVSKVRSPSGKVVGLKQPHSFEILPGAAVTVDPVALHLPQVKAARKSGWLKVEEAKAASAGAKASSPATTSQPPVAEEENGNGGRRKRS